MVDSFLPLPLLVGKQFHSTMKDSLSHNGQRTVATSSAYQWRSCEEGSVSICRSVHSLSQSEQHGCKLRQEVVLVDVQFHVLKIATLYTNNGANFYCRPHPPHTPCVVQKLLRYCSHTDRQCLHNKEGPGLFDKDGYPVDMLEQKQPLPLAHHGSVNQHWPISRCCHHCNSVEWVEEDCLCVC